MWVESHWGGACTFLVQNRAGHLLLKYLVMMEYFGIYDWHTLWSASINGLSLRLLVSICLSSGAIIKKDVHEDVLIKIQMRVSLAEVTTSVPWQQDEIRIDGISPVFLRMEIRAVRLPALVLLFTGVNLKVFGMVLLFFPAVAI